MAGNERPLDPDLLEYLEALNTSVNGLSEEVRFVLAIQEKSLLIAVRLAFLLERIANIVYHLEEGEAEKLSGGQVEAKFKELKDLFDQQMSIMREQTDGDGPK